jgi:hypothetical protein
MRILWYCTVLRVPIAKRSQKTLILAFGQVELIYVRPMAVNVCSVRLKARVWADVPAPFFPSIPKSQYHTLRYAVMGRDADTDGGARRRGREATPTIDRDWVDCTVQCTSTASRRPSGSSAKVPNRQGDAALEARSNHPTIRRQGYRLRFQISISRRKAIIQHVCME